MTTEEVAEVARAAKAAELVKAVNAVKALKVVKVVKVVNVAIAAAALWMLAAAAAAATAMAWPQDRLVLVHDPEDPLHAQFWSGQPHELSRTLPAEVGVVLVPLRGAAALPSWPRGSGGPQTLSSYDALPPAVREGLMRFGHEQRLIEVLDGGAANTGSVAAFYDGLAGAAGSAPHSLVGVGDNGMGRPVGAQPQAYGLLPYGHDACTAQAPAQEVRGMAVLIRRGGCPYVDKVRHARGHGAAAVIFINNELALGRVAGRCQECADVALAVLPQAQGQALLARAEAAQREGRVLQLRMRGQSAPAVAVRVTRQGQVQEVGVLPYPFNSLLEEKLDPFAGLGLEGVAMVHEAALERRLQAQARGGGLRVLPLLRGQRVADERWSGARQRVTVPVPLAWLDAHGLQWDFRLGCEGTLKSHCPPWDYIATAHLCSRAGLERCDLEVGRWITPYWSGGRWVHEVTPLLALLRQAAAAAPRDARGRALLSFEFHSIQPYVVTASLRFSMNPDDRNERLRPQAAVPLDFPGGPMTDGRYNERQGSRPLRVPAWARRVALVSFITGHGFADEQRCAEFCNTVHEFLVDGRVAHVLSQPEATATLGCWSQAGEGVVPNQAGTWVYGRNGWCPGQAVALRVMDITAAMQTAPAGAGVTLNVGYRSTVDGRDHQPHQRGSDGRTPDARLDVTVYAVFYR